MEVFILFFLENFKLALSSLKANKMRAFLTMLGIIIGISSVITIMTLGEAGKASVGKEFEGSKNQIAIRPADWDIGYEDLLNGSDLDKIRNAFSEDIQYFSPVEWSGGKVKKNKVVDEVSILGSNEEYKFIDNVNVIKGRFFSRSDVLGKRNVAVIDKRLALKLFKRTNAVGETLKIDDGYLGQSYVVIGVYEKAPSLFDQIDSAFGYEQTTLYAPFTCVQYDDTYRSIQAVVSEGADITTVSDRIVKFISKIKHKENLYRVQTAQGAQSQLDGILGKLSIGIGAIAAISLLVGGIGVMNIMLVSVTERTREIGIRKALGAKRRDILLQFLVESMIISATGGIIGTSLGLGISNAIALIFHITPTIPITMILIAVSFSAGVGVFFGIYPANKAAKLDPIEALRYE